MKIIDLKMLFAVIKRENCNTKVKIADASRLKISKEITRD